MKPGQRIPIIERCARRLSAGRDWDGIDFILRQFGLPWSDMWNGDAPADTAKFSYVREMLGQAEESDLLALDDYLSGDPDADPDSEPWEVGLFRLFITHVATHKSDAADLK